MANSKNKAELRSGFELKNTWQQRMSWRGLNTALIDVIWMTQNRKILMFFFHPWRGKSSHRAGEIQFFTLESHACQSKWMSMLYTFFDDSCKYQHFLSYPQKWQFQIRHPYKGAESTGCLVFQAPRLISHEHTIPPTFRSQELNRFQILYLKSLPDIILVRIENEQFWHVMTMAHKIHGHFHPHFFSPLSEEQLNHWLLQGSVADVGEGYQRCTWHFCISLSGWWWMIGDR